MAHSFGCRRVCLFALGSAAAHHRYFDTGGGTIPLRRYDGTVQMRTL
jgi:hypothetical protein